MLLFDVSARKLLTFDVNPVATEQNSWVRFLTHAIKTCHVLYPSVKDLNVVSVSFDYIYICIFILKYIYQQNHNLYLKSDNAELILGQIDGRSVKP